MRIILTILLALSLSIASNFKSISLVDFSQIVSNTSSFNIVISDTVKKDLSLFLPNMNFYNKKKTIKILKNILIFNNLSFKLSDGVFYIYDKSKIIKDIVKPKIINYIVKFRNLSNQDIDTYFKKLYPDLKYLVLKGRIFFNTTNEIYKSILKQVKLLDNSFISKTISVTVLSTNDNLSKNKGIDFSVLKFNPSYYVSLVTSSVTFPTTLSSRFQFYSFLHFLKEKNLSKIISNPQIVLSDQKDSLLESTTNIPFLTSTSTTKDNTTTTENSYTYKDVGLKIYFTNVSISKDSINFDLELYIQSILDNTLTPKTSSKHIKTHCTLSNKNVFFLGGLNDTTISDSVSNVPILEYIPIINKVTSHTVKTKENVTFSIVLSVVNNARM